MTTKTLPCDTLQQQTLAAPIHTYAVTDQVLLAAQPQPDDWQRLAQQGFRTVVNIRSDPERAAAQAQTARAAGLDYIYAPLPVYDLAAEHIAEFARIIDNPDHGKLFIHCRSATRVGLLWMLYRIEQQGWSFKQAHLELQAAGYDEDSLETFDFCATDYLERGDYHDPDTT